MTKSRLTAQACLVASLTASWLVAQVQPKPLSSVPEEDVIALSVFEVRAAQDYGYRAANAITATGIGTAIKDVPANIAVLTEEFILDRGATELRDIVNYVSGVNTESRNHNAIGIRGFSALVQRNGVNRPFTYLLDNVERVEVIKGPSSIFHGLVRPGGVVNYITRKPEFRARHEISASYGSYDFRRFGASATGPLPTGKAAYLVSGSATTANDWRDHLGKDDRFLTGAITVKPIGALSATFDWEYVNHEEHPHSLVATSTPAYLAARPPFTTTLLQYVGANFPAGTPYSTIVVDDPTFPSLRFNANGPEGLRVFKGLVYGGDLTLEAREWLSLRVQAADERNERQIRQYFTFRPRADLTFLERASHERNLALVRDVKAQAAITFGVAGTSHRLLVGHQYVMDKRADQTLSSALVRYNPRTDPELRLGELVAAANPAGFPAAVYAETETDYLYAVDQIELLSNRLRFMFGVRHADSTTRAAGSTVDISQARTTPQYAALWRPMPAVTFFANYSESFEPSGLVDGQGRVVGPVEGKGYDLGMKTDWRENTLSGTVSLYSVERGNIAYRDFVRENETNIRPLYLFGGLERSEGVDLDMTYTPTRNYQLLLSYNWAWEAETVENVGEPFQVGRRLTNVPEHVVNLWNKYTFVRGPLRGFSAGGGIKRVASSTYVHASWNTPIIGPPWTRVDLFVGYERRFGRRILTTTLNLDNVSDRQHLDSLVYSAPFKAYLRTTLRF
jgi:iron complex outermembrane recepter protein